MMLTDADTGYVDRIAAMLRIIIVALCMGISTFAILLLVVMKPVPGPSMVLTTTLFFICAITTVLAIVLPKFLASYQCQKIAKDEFSATTTPLPKDVDSRVANLAGCYQTTAIIGSALFEATGFFALIAYMLEGHYASLGIASVMLFGIMLQFPIPGQLETWIENKLQDMQ